MCKRISFQQKLENKKKSKKERMRDREREKAVLN